MKNKAIVGILISVLIYLVAWILIPAVIFIVNALVDPLTFSSVMATHDWFSGWFGIGQIRDIKLVLIVLVVLPVAIALLIWSKRGAGKTHDKKTSIFRRKNATFLDDLPEAAGNNEMGSSYLIHEPRELAATTEMFSIALDKSRPAAAGVVLGSDGTNLYMDTQDDHAAIIASPGSGKTRRCILPTIWALAQAGESMIILDLKDELHTFASPFLREHGYRVACIDWDELRLSNQDNMLEPVIAAYERGDIAEASRCSQDVAYNLVPDPIGRTADIWVTGSRSTINATILLVCLSKNCSREQKNLASVKETYLKLSEIPRGKNDSRLTLTIERLKREQPDHPAIEAYATVLSGKNSQNFYGSLNASVMDYLRLVGDRNIMDMSMVTDVALDTVGEIKTAIFLKIPNSRPAYQAFAVMYFTRAFQAHCECAKRHGGRTPIRVNMICEEFGVTPAIPSLKFMLSEGRSLGFRVYLCIQAIAQLYDIYGKPVTETILECCKVKILFGTIDNATKEYFSRQCGVYTIKTSSYSDSAQSTMFSTRNESESLCQRKVMTEDEIGLISPDTGALVLRAGLHPSVFPVRDLSVLNPINDSFGMGTQEFNLRLAIERNAEWRMNPPMRPQITPWVFEFEKKTAAPASKPAQEPIDLEVQETTPATEPSTHRGGQAARQRRTLYRATEREASR